MNPAALVLSLLDGELDSIAAPRAVKPQRVDVEARHAA
jgi:hypothetical protein